MKVTTLFVLIVVLLALAFPFPILASRVGVTPQELHFDAHSEGSTSTLHVVNSGDGRAHYMVYAEGGYDGWFNISPEEFLLEPDQSMEVNIALSTPFTASGEHQTNICVISVGPSPGLRVGVGIKIPTQISISWPLMPITVGISGILLTALAACLIRRRRKTVGAC